MMPRCRCRGADAGSPMLMRLRLRQSFGVLALGTAFTRHWQRKLEHSILEVNAELRTVNAVCSFARSSPCIPTGRSPTILPKNMLLTCRFSASLLARIGSAVRREAFRASGGDRRLIRMDHTDSPGRLLGDLMLRGARITGGDLRDLEIRDSQVDGLRILDSIGTTVSVSGALQKTSSMTSTSRRTCRACSMRATRAAGRRARQRLRRTSVGPGRSCRPGGTSCSAHCERRRRPARTPR